MLLCDAWASIGLYVSGNAMYVWAKCIAIHDQFNTCIGLHMYNTYGLPAGQYVEVHA